MANKTDWFLESLEGGENNKDKTNAYNSGFDFELRNPDDYWSKKSIREKYENDQARFEKDYNQSVSSYNEFQQYNYDLKVGTSPELFDTKLNRDLNLPIMKKPVELLTGKDANNPFRISKGFKGLNEEGNRTQSMMELAATNTRYYDTTTNKWVEKSVNSEYSGIVDFFTAPDSFVMAKHDKDVKDEEGRLIHKKGDPKVDDVTGTFYFETLGDRSIKGKEQDLYKLSDGLTEENSVMNKIDFFDSDDLEKSFTGSLVKNAVKAGIMFVPYVGAAYGYALAGKELMSTGETIANAIDGLDGKTSKGFFGNVNEQLERTMGGTSSENSQNNFFTWENVLNIAGDSVTQLKQQQALTSIPAKVQSVMNPKNWKELKGVSWAQNIDKITDMDFVRKNTDPKVFEKYLNIGSNMTNTYMAATSAKEITDLANEIGIEPADQIGLFALSTALNYKLYKASPFERWAEQKFRIDDDALAVKKIFKGLTPEFKNEVKQELSEATTEEAKKSVLGKLTDKIKTGYNEFASNPKGFIQQAKDWALNTPYSQTASRTSQLVAGAVNEGLEETTEVALNEGIRQLYNGYKSISEKLGLKDPDEKKKFKTVFNDSERVTEFFKEVGSAAFGGALGGATFKGIDFLNNKTKTNLDADILDFIKEGKTEKLYETLDKLKQEGIFGSKELSISPVSGVNNDKTLYKPVDRNSTDNNQKVSQNDYVANAIKESIRTAEATYKYYQADKESVDKVLSKYDENFDNLFKTELTTSVKNDIQATADEINTTQNEIKDLQNKLKAPNIDSIEAEQISKEISQKQSKIKNLAVELEEIRDSSDIKKDEYLNQAVYAQHPAYLQGFGLQLFDDKNKNSKIDFLSSYAKSLNKTKESLSTDEKTEARNKYIQEYVNTGKKQKDFKRALKEFKAWSEKNPTTKNISNLRNQEKAYHQNKNIREILDEIDEKKDKPAFEKLMSEMSEMVAKNELNVDKRTKAKVEKLRKDFKSDKKLFNKKDLAVQDLVKNHELFSNFSTSIKRDLHNKELQNIIEYKTNNATDKKLVDAAILFELKELINQIEIGIEDPPNDLTLKDLTDTVKYLQGDASKSNKLTSQVEKFKKDIDALELNDNNEYDDVLSTLFSKYDKLITEEFKALNEKGEDNYIDTSGSKIEQLEGAIADIVKEASFIGALTFVNPKINQFKNSEEKLFELTDEQRKDFLRELSEYVIQIEFLKDKLVANTQAIFKNIKKYEIKHFKEQIRIIKSHDNTINAPKIESFDYETTEVTDELKQEFYQEYVDTLKQFKANFDLKEEVKTSVNNVIAKNNLLQTIEYNIDDVKYNTDVEAVFLNTVLRNADVEDFLVKYRKALETTDNYAPLYPQEWSVFQAWTLSKDQSNIMFNNTDWVKKNITSFDENAVDNFMFKNAMFIDGIAGAGKSQQVLKTLNTIFVQEGKKAMYFAPAESQLGTLESALTDAKKGGDFNTLLKTLTGLGSTSNLNSDKEIVNQYATGINYEESVEITPNIEFFDGVDFLFIDEATHIPYTDSYAISKGLTILNQKRKQDGKSPLILYFVGDTEQLGHLDSNGYSQNIDAIGIEKTPKLNLSLRQQYPHLERTISDIRTLFNQLEKVSDDDKKSFIVKNIEIGTEFYEDDNTMIGVNKSDETNAIIKAKKMLDLAIKNNESFAFITNNPTESKLKKFFGDKWNSKHINVFTPKTIQGREFEYVVIDDIVNTHTNNPIKRELEFLNTMLSRSKKATVFIGSNTNGIKFATTIVSDRKYKHVNLDSVVLDKIKTSKINSLSKISVKNTTEAKFTTPEAIENKETSTNTEATSTATTTTDEVVIDDVFSDTSTVFNDDLPPVMRVRRDGNRKINLQDTGGYEISLHSWFSNEKDIEQISKLLPDLTEDKKYEAIAKLKLRIMGYKVPYADLKVREADITNVEFVIKSDSNLASADHTTKGGLEGDLGTANNIQKSISIRVKFQHKGQSYDFTIAQFPNVWDMRNKTEHGTVGSGFGIKNNNEAAYNDILNIVNIIENDVDNIIAQDVVKNIFKRTNVGKIYRLQNKQKQSFKDLIAKNKEIHFGKPFIYTGQTVDIEKLSTEERAKYDRMAKYQGKAVVFYSFNNENIDGVNNDDLFRTWSTDAKKAKIGMVMLDTNTMPMKEWLTLYQEQAKQKDQDFFALIESLSTFSARRKFIKMLFDTFSNLAAKTLKNEQLSDVEMLFLKQYQYIQKDEDTLFPNNTEITKGISNESLKRVKFSKILNVFSSEKLLKDKTEEMLDFLDSQSIEMFPNGIHMGFTPIFGNKNSSGRITAEIETDNLMTNIDYISLPQIYLTINELNQMLKQKETQEEEVVEEEMEEEQPVEEDLQNQQTQSSNTQTQPSKNNVNNINVKIVDIERRRQEELKNQSLFSTTEFRDKGLKNEINDKYDAELNALKGETAQTQPIPKTAEEIKVGTFYRVISSTGSIDGVFKITADKGDRWLIENIKGGRGSISKTDFNKKLKVADGVTEVKYRLLTDADITTESEEYLDSVDEAYSAHLKQEKLDLEYSKLDGFIGSNTFKLFLNDFIDKKINAEKFATEYNNIKRLNNQSADLKNTVRNIITLKSC